VSRDTGPLNIYRGDGAFDYLVDLVYDKLFAPSPYVSEPQPWPAERSATPGVHPKHHPGTAAASPPPINEPGPSKTSRPDPSQTRSKFDFSPSRSVAKRLGQAGDDRTGDFHHLIGARRYVERLVVPHLAPVDREGGDGLGESGRLIAYAGGMFWLSRKRLVGS
jgi:hypothetical protein